MECSSFKFSLCEHDVLCSVILTPCHLFCQLFVTLCSPLPSLTRSPAEAACFYGLSTYFGRVGREAPPTVGLLFTSHPGMLMHFEFSSQILRPIDWLLLFWLPMHMSAFKLKESKFAAINIFNFTFQIWYLILSPKDVQRNEKCFLPFFFNDIICKFC